MSNNYKKQGKFKPSNKKYNQKKSYGGYHKGKSFDKEKLPYYFVKRDGGKEAPEAFHDKLKEKRYDIAFDVIWKTLTPTALNPCTDINLSACEAFREEDYLKGYDKRWLSVEKHFVISPFTVKSAIANGFANLLGSCYRVIDTVKGHGDLGEGQYPYGAAYKRYRVNMEMSKPAILTKVQKNHDGSKTIELQPVEECYYDKPTPPQGIQLSQGQSYFARVELNKHKNFITSLANQATQQASTHVIYYGPYRFGMNLTLKPGEFKKDHHHRFYSVKDKTLSGVIPKENFEDQNKLKGRVYMGTFKRMYDDRVDPRGDLDGGFWYEDLDQLEVGDWVYFEQFKNRVTHIGQNFQFKALFLHSDTVPEENSQCKDINLLCPRCRLFGMTEDSKKQDRNAIGLKGRFKSSGLVCTTPWESEAERRADFKFHMPKNPVLKTWYDKDNNRLAYQSLLPIQGPPKPNKRDTNGYFDKDSGQLKGAKVYRHSNLKNADNIQHVDDKPDKDYTHSLRNCAQVCEPGLEFHGTVGAENCSMEEIAALLTVLESRLNNHGFKLGLGKAFGLGTVKSIVNTVYVRSNEAYDKWEKRPDLKKGPRADFIKQIEIILPGIEKELGLLREVEKKINSLTKFTDNTFSYPKPSSYYWQNVSW